MIDGETEAQFLVIVSPVTVVRVLGKRDVLQMFPWAKQWVDDALIGDVLNNTDPTAQITCLGIGKASTSAKPRKKAVRR